MVHNLPLSIMVSVLFVTITIHHLLVKNWPTSLRQVVSDAFPGPVVFASKDAHTIVLESNNVLARRVRTTITGGEFHHAEDATSRFFLRHSTITPATLRHPLKFSTVKTKWVTAGVKHVGYDAGRGVID